MHTIPDPDNGTAITNLIKNMNKDCHADSLRNRVRAAQYRQHLSMAGLKCLTRMGPDCPEMRSQVKPRRRCGSISRRTASAFPASILARSRRRWCRCRRMTARRLQANWANSPRPSGPRCAWRSIPWTWAGWSSRRSRKRRMHILNDSEFLEEVKERHRAIEDAFSRPCRCRRRAPPSSGSGARRPTGYSLPCRRRTDRGALPPVRALSA